MKDAREIIAGISAAARQLLTRVEGDGAITPICDTAVRLRCFELASPLPDVGEALDPLSQRIANARAIYAFVSGEGSGGDE